MINSKKIQPTIYKLQKEMEQDPDILAIILYGSYARGEEAQDVDLCLVLYPDKATNSFDKQIEYSYYDKIDVQIFQDLPLYIRPHVIKEGLVLSVKDENLLYDVAIQNAKEYELYRPKYEMYLEGVKGN
ncbi:MAG: nucleotidyltransferase domain-containing protein [Methanobacteriaceae archaeon]|nr:nucleotidyltransferase domain-containing protein [Methanobacteriaceae archaeon]